MGMTWSLLFTRNKHNIDAYTLRPNPVTLQQSFSSFNRLCWLQQ